MSVILLFLAVIGALIGWWLAGQRLTAKPWLEQGVIGDVPAATRAPAPKTGLVVFLAVVGSLFALFISAYFMRMGMADWWALPVPGLLWFNTCLLVASSLTLQGALAAAHQRKIGLVRVLLLAGGIAALAFLAGQAMAWRELVVAGYGMTSNPANSFFYLITGIHGLHVAGGIVALVRTAGRAWKNVRIDRLLPSVELSAIYWHFMLFVWLILFGLLAGWANDFADICRQVLS